MLEFIQQPQNCSGLSQRSYYLARPGQITSPLYALIPPRQNETQLFRYSLLTYCGSETFALPSRYSRPANSPQRNGPEGHHDILIIPVRDDVPYDAAKAEIITYIETPGNEDLSIGEIARKLRLDLDIVIDVFEERGLL